MTFNQQNERLLKFDAQLNQIDREENAQLFDAEYDKIVEELLDDNILIFKDAQDASYDAQEMCCDENCDMDVDEYIIEFDNFAIVNKEKLIDAIQTFKENNARKKALWQYCYRELERYHIKETLSHERLTIRKSDHPDAFADKFDFNIDYYDIFKNDIIADYYDEYNYSSYLYYPDFENKKDVDDFIYDVVTLIYDYCYDLIDDLDLSEKNVDELLIEYDDFVVNTDYTAKKELLKALRKWIA